MEKDLKSSVNAGSAFDVQAITSDTTTVGNIIDSKGFESLVISIQAGVLTDGAYAITVNSGDVLSGGTPDATFANIIRGGTLTDAAAVATDLIIGSLPSFADTEDSITKLFGLVGKERYFQISIVSTSTTTGGTIGAQAVLGDAGSQPTS